MSFPKARNISANNMNIPTICAYSRTLSFGFFPVIISNRTKIIWPPSSAGIGRRLSTASIIDSHAVMFQNICQSQEDGKIFPIEMKLPTDL